MRFRSRPISRRAWLASLASGALTPRADAQNVVSPLQEIPGRVTPAARFFVRNHFAEPELSIESWTLTIEGRCARRTRLSFSDLLEAPPAKLEAVLECAGNPASGPAVSNGIWEGVRLAWMIDQARPDSSATHILLEGADSGSLLAGFPVAQYSRLAPLAKCKDRNSLLALKLNGLFLPRRNGFPARALLPGWYAMDSVKWLRRIVLLGPEDKPAAIFESGMQRLYTRLLHDRAGQRVSEILIKSAIAYPSDGATLFSGDHNIRGFAWTGSGVVRRVEISLDGGRTWSSAQLESSAQALTWVRWSYGWKAAPGKYALMSRASDDSGRRQPLDRDPAREDGYELNWCAPVRCAVK